MNRFADVALGYDVKSNMKPIKTCPGPADYELVNDGDSAVVKPCFNFKLNRGGVPLVNSSATNKEDLITRSMQGPNSPANLASFAHNSTSGSVFSKQRESTNHILMNKLAVNSKNLLPHFNKST